MLRKLAVALVATGLVGAVAVSTNAYARGAHVSVGHGSNMMARGNFAPSMRNFGNSYGAVAPGQRYGFRGRRGFGGFYGGFGWNYPYYASACDPYNNYYYQPYGACTYGYGWGYY